jgi:hypothetical protein
MFVSYELWPEEQNILLQHMHKKEFKHENEAKWPKKQKLFFMHVLKKDALLLWP